MAYYRIFILGYYFQSLAISGEIILPFDFVQIMFIIQLILQASLREILCLTPVSVFISAMTLDMNLISINQISIL